MTGEPTTPSEHIDDDDNAERKHQAAIREKTRLEILRRCPDLGAHLFDMEQTAEPFFGITDGPYEEDWDEIRPF